MMPLPTEVFVMVVFLIGFPLFYGAIRSARLPGSTCFIVAYAFLLLSNIFTVIEDCFWYHLFNHLEHACMALSAMAMFAAICKFVRGEAAGRPDRPQDSSAEAPR